MIRFLIKGLWRDSGRSRLPMIVVALGVMLTVFLHAYIVGFMGDTIEINAKFTYGHLQVVTHAAAENSNQMALDLALLETPDLVSSLKASYPAMDWSERIRFGGLADVPDENGETRAQGPVSGLALNMSERNNSDAVRLDIAKSLVRGRMPAPGEVLMSEHLANYLKMNPGDIFTLMTSTMEGSMAMGNFVLSGTVAFGVEALDRGTILTDIHTIRPLLDMNNASTEILGFFNSGFYDQNEAAVVVAHFNQQFNAANDSFVPFMQSLEQQGSMGQYVAMTQQWSLYISAVFILAMALVLWNAGLLGGLRRYGEVGLRLAIGEEKWRIYISMLAESFFVGLAGTIVGTLLGLLLAFLLQTYGLDISGMMKGSSLMFPGIIRARITPVDFYIGFIPGIMSTLIGTALSGIGIFKRQTASLFKELEV